MQKKGRERRRESRRKETIKRGKEARWRKERKKGTEGRRGEGKGRKYQSEERREENKEGGDALEHPNKYEVSSLQTSKSLGEGGGGVPSQPLQLQF